MTSTALRQELHAAIDTMPEKNLVVIKPLLSVLAEPLYTIEPATPEEPKRAERRIREYHKDPSSFIPRAKRTGLKGAIQ
ncbi:hypothetical protein FACS189442_6060 [Spirochaetia bacterium]|nr:hypothetical protein FACS189442_6060 [Spirochaetia bacterium]